MPSIDNSLPLAVAIRLNIQESVGDRTQLDYKSILERIQADGKVSAAELNAVQQALAAEVAAGSIDEARGKHIMSVIAGRLSELDTFARDFATAANAIQSANYGIDGSTGVNLLTTGSANGALTLSLDPGIAGQPQRLATAGSATSPGSTTGIQAFLGLETARVANGGTSTLQESAMATITNAGSEASRANADDAIEQARTAQLNAAREEVSGVSIEDEMLSIERYQRAYQAAARVITTVNEMLDTLMRM